MCNRRSRVEPCEFRRVPVAGRLGSGGDNALSSREKSLILSDTFGHTRLSQFEITPTLTLQVITSILMCTNTCFRRLCLACRGDQGSNGGRRHGPLGCSSSAAARRAKRVWKSHGFLRVLLKGYTMLFSGEGGRFRSIPFVAFQARVVWW